MFTIKRIIIAASILFTIAVLTWVFMESNKPMPGQKLEKLGRNHVTPGQVVEYNSNPPTSSNHYPDWTRPGIYSTIPDDRYLVHSLEHGYIIISYNCDSPTKTQTGLKLDSYQPEASSVAILKAATDSGIPVNFQNCSDQVDKLTQIYNKKGPYKLIMVPRPSLDSKIALTAWGTLLKLDQIDEKQILDFINAYRNRGPEQTMEP